MLKPLPWDCRSGNMQRSQVSSEGNYSGNVNDDDDGDYYEVFGCVDGYIIGVDWYQIGEKLCW